MAVSLLGTVLVTAYALWALFQIFWLNPDAAVPGDQHDQIRQDLAQAGESMNIRQAVAIMSVGPAVAVVVLVAVAVRTGTDPLAPATIYLMILVCGPLAYMGASFGPGMALADTYAIGGGDHSPWALPLYLVSAAALLALIGVAVAAMRRGGRRTV
ncbi:hypothetical protein [Nesterenkonia sp. F]|uniref:hypothetical protein n=1 Tax=Nesterenkonia sp. F TaxID=795955 RepID=UPI000255D585|nr:hypothetical protein [Nesterenkonia sp. F]